MGNLLMVTLKYTYGVIKYDWHVGCFGDLTDLKKVVGKGVYIKDIEKDEVGFNYVKTNGSDCDSMSIW